MTLARERGPWPAPPADGPAANDSSDFTACPQLSRREAALLLIAADVRLGVNETPFELHVEEALEQADIPLDDLRELLRHVAPYAGINSTLSAFERLMEIVEPRTFAAAAQAEFAIESAAPAYTSWALEGIQSLDPLFAEQLCRSADEVWARSGLSRRERALASLAIDIAGGTFGSSFALHLALAEEHGVSREELLGCIRLISKHAPGRAVQAVEALTILEAEAA